jgi:hypothetical protein
VSRRVAAVVAWQLLLPSRVPLMCGAVGPTQLRSTALAACDAVW